MDYFNLCRLCLNSNCDCFDLFSEKLNIEKTTDKILKYLYMEIKIDDNLPRIICEKCKEMIDNFNLFVEQVAANQRVLQSITQATNMLNVNEKSITLLPTEYIKIELPNLTYNHSFEKVNTNTLISLETNKKIIETQPISIIMSNENKTIKNIDSTLRFVTILNSEKVRPEMDITSKLVSNIDLFNDQILNMDSCENDRNQKDYFEEEEKRTEEIRDIKKNKYNSNRLMQTSEALDAVKNEEDCDSDSNDSIFILDQSENTKTIPGVGDNSVTLTTQLIKDSRLDSNNGIFILDQSENTKTIPGVEDNNVTLTTQLIKDSRLVIRGKFLLELMSKFYRMECELCNKLDKHLFGNLTDLCNHYHNKHSIKGYITCCGIKLVKHRAMAMHMARHLQPEAFRCPKCNKMMTCPKILQYHIQNHLPEEKRPLACPECPRKFSYSSALVAHSISHQPESEREAHICDECGKSFVSSGRLSTHITTVHIKHEQTYVCHICPKQFSGKGNLQYHITTHQPRMHQEQCEQCGKWLKNKLCLRKHMVQHSSVKFSCHLCAYTALNRQCVRNHIKVQHSDAKPFSCEICGRSFKLKNTLINHMVQHTGVKKFSCQFCSRTFASSGNYYSHRKRMHPNELAVFKLQQEEEECKLRAQALQMKRDISEKRINEIA